MVVARRAFVRIRGRADRDGPLMAEPPIEQLRAINREAMQLERARAFLGSLTEAILDALPDGLIVTTAAGEIVMFNARAEHLFRYPRDEVIGKQIEVLLPERNRADHIQHRKLYNEADFSPWGRTMGQGLQISGLAKDGTEFPINVTLAQMVTVGGLYNMASIRRALPGAT